MTKDADTRSEIDSGHGDRAGGGCVEKTTLRYTAAMSALPAPFYADESVTLFHADCREILPLLDRVDVTITDPPYEAEAHTLGRRIAAGVGREGPSAIRASSMTFDPMSADLRCFAGREIARLTARWALVFCQIEAAMTWRSVLEQATTRYMRTMIWAKPNGQPQLTGDRPGMGYESIVVMHGAGASRWNGGGRRGWFDYATDGNFSRNPRFHEAQKPLEFIRDLVRLFSDPGELILDPFAGSGTLGVAARAEGRRAILIEKDEQYADITARRLECGDVGMRQPDQLMLWSAP